MNTLLSTTTVQARPWDPLCGPSIFHQRKQWYRQKKATACLLGLVLFHSAKKMALKGYLDKDEAINPSYYPSSILQQTTALIMAPSFPPFWGSLVGDLSLLCYPTSTTINIRNVASRLFMLWADMMDGTSLLSL